MLTVYIETRLWLHTEEDGTVGDVDSVYRDVAMTPQ